MDIPIAHGEWCLIPAWREFDDTFLHCGVNRKVSERGIEIGSRQVYQLETKTTDFQADDRDSLRFGCKLSPIWKFRRKGIRRRKGKVHVFVRFCGFGKRCVSNFTPNRLRVQTLTLAVAERGFVVPGNKERIVGP